MKNSLVLFLQFAKNSVFTSFTHLKSLGDLFSYFKYFTGISCITLIIKENFHLNNTAAAALIIIQRIDESTARDY